MGRPSKIDRLPKVLRDQIGELRTAGHTIDEILTHLHQLGETQIKRTGLGEHIKRLDEIGDEMRREQAMASALVAQLDEDMDDKLFRLNVKMLQGMLLKVNMAIREQSAADLSPADLAQLSKVMQHLASASKSDTDRVEKLEKRAREKALKAAEAAVQAEAENAKATGRALDPEAVLKRIKDVYG